MRFFEDFKVPKDQAIGITNLLSNITTRPGSHKGGWVRLLKCQLKNAGYNNVTVLDNKDSFANYGTIIFDLGAEYSGALNMFGGLDEKVFKRLNEIHDFKGQLFSWKNELADVNVLESRRSNVSTCEAFKATDAGFLGRVAAVLATAKTFDHTYRTNGLLIGDSHTPSVWTPEFMIERRDGRTLKGMIEHGTIKRLVMQYRLAGHDINAVHVHCGSIDIRHHVHREPEPDLYVVDLATKLLDKMMEISDAKLIVTHTMGIEDESRELPKTGYFKGTPFTGSWAQRNRSREIFNAVMDELKRMDHDTEVITMPGYFFGQDGKLQFEVMEKPQSVHLSPEHYRWDLDNNRDRWIHEKGR